MARLRWFCELAARRSSPWNTNEEDYSKFALEAAKVMKWTDPSIKLVASGSSNYGADWIGWNRTVLRSLRSHIDYIAVWELNHPGLKATHTFEDDERVRPVTRTVSVEVADGQFGYTFPAPSLTILRFDPR